LVTLIVCRPGACPVTPPYLPLAAPSSASMGDLALVCLSLPQMVAVPWEMPALEESKPEVREALDNLRKQM
jgi:hypothetical protein